MSLFAQVDCSPPLQAPEDLCLARLLGDEVPSHPSYLASLPTPRPLTACVFPTQLPVLDLATAVAHSNKVFSRIRGPAQRVPKGPDQNPAANAQCRPCQAQHWGGAASAGRSELRGLIMRSWNLLAACLAPD